MIVGAQFGNCAGLDSDPALVYLDHFRLIIMRIGGPEGIRTLDLFHAMEARSQLRHRPISATCFHHTPMSVKHSLSIGPNPYPSPSHLTMKSMRKLHRHAPVAGALLLASLSSSCGFLTKTRVIVRHGRPATAAQTLLVATRDELNARIARMYGAINSFQANVDMTPSEGSVYKGRITEIKDILAIVLFRKPAEIRIIGKAPVVRTTAFDMVSNGSEFKFFLPIRNLFVEGANNAPTTSKNKIENLRPDAFFSSMLIRPADEATEVPTLIDQTDEDNALYILHFLRKSSLTQVPFIVRSVWFDRLDLSIVRQIVYDVDNAILSDTRYSKWQPYGDEKTLFPAHIDLNRPKDGYGVVMDVIDMKMNKPMTEEMFQLTQPEGTRLQKIGAPPAPTTGGTH
jgi:hypothetical protein